MEPPEPRHGSAIQTTTTAAQRSHRAGGKRRTICLAADAHSDGRCIGLGSEEEFDDLLSTAELVFVGAPDKGGGSTMEQFVKECVGAPGNPTMCLNKWGCEHHWASSGNRFFSYVDKVEAPRLVGTHITKDQTLIRMFRNSNKHTWVVYAHREETDRLASAVKQVVERHHGKLRTDPETIVEGKKVLDEEKLIQLIQSRIDETGNGGVETLTCDMYDAIEENAPNLLFVDFKQLNKLQTILSKHYCPERLHLDEGPVEANVAKHKNLNFMVKMPAVTESKIQNTTGGLVDFHRWVDGKRHMFEWALDHGRNRTCLGKTKRVEDRMSACPDKAFRVITSNDRPPSLFG